MMITQKDVLDFCNRYHIDCSFESRLLDVISELGELSKEVLKASDYGKKHDINCTEDLLLEFGDVFFSLNCLANTLGIDMNKAIEFALAKYEKRFVERSSVSSK